MTPEVVTFKDPDRFVAIHGLFHAGRCIGLNLDMPDGPPIPVRIVACHPEKCAFSVVPVE